jgi:hypothetical protein
MNSQSWPLRTFEVWSFTCSHGVLVLRSNKAVGVATRIEVVWRGVRHISLTSPLRHVVVRPALPEEIELVASRLPDSIADNEAVYVVEADGCTGYVVATHCAVYEDTREYFDPSSAP